MQYLLLIYRSEAEMAKIPPADLKRHVTRKYGKFHPGKSPIVQIYVWRGISEADHHRDQPFASADG